MSLQSYRLGQCQAATEQRQIRIITATRELLVESLGFSSISPEAVVCMTIQMVTLYQLCL